MEGEDFQEESSEAVLEDKITSRAHEVSQFSATGLKNHIKKIYGYQESPELLMTKELNHRMPQF